MIAVTAKLSWYVARSSGIVAWATVTASILWGLALSSRLVRKRGVPAWLLDLHRYLGTLSLVFVLVHLFGLWADNFVYFGPSEMFVPMKSPWKTGAVAWGIVAFYFLAAIQISSWLMRHTLLQWFVVASTILVVQLTLFRLITLRSAQKWALRPETPTKASDRIRTG